MKPPARHGALPPLAACLLTPLVVLSVLAQEPVFTEPEILERLAALADSLVVEGYAIDEIEIFQQAMRDSLEAIQEEEIIDDGPAPSVFYGLSNENTARVQADVTRVTYRNELRNTLRVLGGGRMRSSFSLAYDTYRRQTKTVENRAASGSYDSGSLLPFTMSTQVSTNWVEDLTTNTAGYTNENRRETRRAGISLGKTSLHTGPVRHNLQANWSFNDRRAVNQRQRNDSQDNELSGALRSGLTVADGLNVTTRLYRIGRDGENLLAEFTNPSSTTGDSLGFGVHYDRPSLQGHITVTRSSFDRRYLDFRRNSNGLIDTTNLPDGVSKVVQELEEKDALTLNWDNTVRMGRRRFSVRVRHTIDNQQYAFSQIGRRERSNDSMDLQFLTPVGRDSFAIAYKYEWNWDDQRYAGATEFRGRQFRKRRDLSVDWHRRLFRNTTIAGRYRTELAQDIAQNVFNENDRDRLTEEGRLRLEAFWRQRFRATMVAEYQSINDVSIRASRSANNNVRRTFEVAPGYRIFISPNLELAQTYRMYIQYQDHDFAYLETVNKQDSYNKRGSLATSLKVKPIPRLELTINHDYNQRYNGTRTVRDAAGNTYYRRDQDQTINRIDLGFTWTPVFWASGEHLRLQTATYRTRDFVERHGPTSSTLTERFSGELWVGAEFNRKWGSESSPLSINANVRRYLAYGPNVTETSKDYWRADASLRWVF